jgi:hypothetical protein
MVRAEKLLQTFVIFEKRQEVKMKWLLQYILKKYKKCRKEWKKLLECLKGQVEEFWKSEKNTRDKALHLECLARSIISLKWIIEIDDFDKCVVWCTFHSFYAREGTVPTIAKLLVKPKDSIDFKGSCSSRTRIVRDLDCRCKKTRTNRGSIWKAQYMVYMHIVHPVIFKD